MDQNLYFQRYSLPAKREQSFFSCLNCLPQPQYAEYILIQKSAADKNDKQSYLYPSTITQDEWRSSLRSNAQSSMAESRKSMNTKDNKKDVISLRKSRKSINDGRQTILLPERPESHDLRFVKETKRTPQSLQMQQTNTNLPNARLSLPQTVTTNTPKQSIEEIKKMQASRPSVAFSYQRDPSAGNLLQNPRAIQSKQNKDFISQSPLKQTESFLKNSDTNINHTTQNLQQIYADKQILQSLQLQQKKLSSTSKQSSKLKKNNFGKGKLRFQVRQTISIREPEQQDIHESIVLENINLASLHRPISGLLKPITESDMELESFIGTSLPNR